MAYDTIYHILRKHGFEKLFCHQH